MQPFESARPLERIIERFLLPIYKFLLNYTFPLYLTYVERYREKQPWEAHYYILLYSLNVFEDIICYITLGLLLKTHRRNVSALGNKNSCTSPNHWFVFNLLHAMNLVYSWALEAKKHSHTLGIITKGTLCANLTLGFIVSFISLFSFDLNFFTHLCF